MGRILREVEKETDIMFGKKTTVGNYSLNVYGASWKSDNPSVLVGQNGDPSKKIRISDTYARIDALRRALERGYYSMDSLYMENEGQEHPLSELEAANEGLHKAVQKALDENRPRPQSDISNEAFMRYTQNYLAAKRTA